MKRFGLPGFLLLAGLRRASGSAGAGARQLLAEVQQRVRLWLQPSGRMQLALPVPTARESRSFAAQQLWFRRGYAVALNATFFLLCIASTPAALAEPGDHSVGLTIGQSWPAGEIGQGLDGALTGGLFYEYAASDIFSVYASGLRASYNEGSLKLTSTSVGIKANLFYIDKLSPYAMLGAGLYFVDKQYGAERAEKTNFGLHLGLGAELDLSDRFFMGLEFDVHNLFSSTINLPARGRTEISGRWSGFFLRGGVRF